MITAVNLHRPEPVGVARRLRILGALDLVATLAAAVVLLSVPAWPFAGPVPANPSGPASLPREFAPYSGLTAPVRSHPAGRAIALYESGSSELFTTWQTLLAGADRDTYRTVAANGDPASYARLSPDGTHVLLYRTRAGTGGFTLLDLATGRTRALHTVAWHSNVGAGLDVLAWSLDGRYLAYAVPAPPPGDGRAESSFLDGEPIRQLAVLDLARDSTARYAALGPVSAAAFTPTGDRLVIQTRRDAWIVTLDGERLRRVVLPAGMNLVPDTAWSPDGSLIAVTNGTVLGFLDGTGAGRGVPGSLPYRELLGWRGPGDLLSLSGRDGTGRIAVVDLNVHSGQTRVLSRFSDARVCEYRTRRCGTYRIQLARALLASVSIRPSDPDRGPWPGPLRVAVAAVAVIAAACGGYGLRRRL